ncbi:MAG: alpha/beta fold hydrolase [Solirubrobacterales bacterium]
MTGEFTYEGYRLSYDEYGAGDRPIVLIHGLLMNRHMFERLGPDLAERGNRVLALDLLGHGRSDRPEDLQRYSMPLFAYQVNALLDHLEIETAAVGGTSLGANVTLETAVRFPERVQALFVEMPVLDNALGAVAAIFAPILIALRFGQPVFEAVSRATSMLPRSQFMVDLGLDMVRQRPGPSLAVLEGLLLGETSPRSAERRAIEQPALIVGHPNDPLHPFSDAGMLTAELPNAHQVDADSILEWRLNPERLNAELAAFLDRVWTGAEEQRRPERKARMAGA